jgi:hypothetical protein
MNLTGQPVYAKGLKRKSRSRPPNAAERKHWEQVRSLGCMAKGCRSTAPEIHHCETGGGGRKDHMKVIGLCETHHRGRLGIHTISRRVWQEQFGTEQEHLARVALSLT